MITNTMLPEIGREMLTRLAEGQEVSKVEIAVKDGNFTYAFA
jgi:type VI secretion system protein VasG